jgi:uncharacterized lipoprotein NlpE involved in copper resistance
MRNLTAISRISVGAMLGLAMVTAAACSNPVSGTGSTAAGIGSIGTDSAGSSSARSGGAASPKAAAQALLDGVKANDAAKIKDATCEHWPSIDGKGKFDLNVEMDPPAQRAFPKSVVGEPRRDGDAWRVPMTMQDEMGTNTATVKVIQEGGGYVACGMGLEIGG